jgi:hypothetical protein
LDGTLPIRGRDGSIVPVEEYRKSFNQYENLIAFLFDLENKLMTITITEYWNLPCTFIDAMRIYTSVRNEMKHEEESEQ